MERHFDQELAALREKLLEMSGTVEQSVHKATRALETRDPVLVEEVFTDDKRVDVLEIEIGDLCVSLLALRQPMAVDLRFIVGAIVINNELERMGDHAVNIAQCVRDLLRMPAHKPPVDIERMVQLVTGMVKESLDAFISRDASKAQAVCERDDRVDDLKTQIVDRLVGIMTMNSDAINRGVSLILISRNLERIADLATNIAEETIFISEARVIKHHAEEGEIT